MSKAQGLSLNTIILAGLGLVVLSVLVMLFNGNLGGFGTKLSQGGEQECRDGVNGFKQMKGSCGEDSGYLYTQYFGNFKEGALKEGQVCCRSECEARNGICQSLTTPCGVGKTIIGGETGCPADYDCCQK